EIFGPILPIVTVEDVGEAIEFVNEGDRPLAIYVFATDKKVKDRVRSETTSGTMAFNECVIQLGANGLPFGGTGASGYGYHRGKVNGGFHYSQEWRAGLMNFVLRLIVSPQFGFEAFSHLRTEIDSPAFVDKLLWWRFPPYTDGKLRAMFRLMKDGLPAKPKGPPRGEGSRTGWGKWLVVALAVAAAAAAKKGVERK
ncbi:Aldehyde/histidinol dehydrogenase, partial [Schizophyllum fasciatum]